MLHICTVGLMSSDPTFTELKVLEETFNEETENAAEKGCRMKQVSITITDI